MLYELHVASKKSTGGMSISIWQNFTPPVEKLFRSRCQINSERPALVDRRA